MFTIICSRKGLLEYIFFLVNYNPLNQRNTNFYSLEKFKKDLLIVFCLHNLQLSGIGYRMNFYMTFTNSFVVFKLLGYTVIQPGLSPKDETIKRRPKTRKIRPFRLYIKFKMLKVMIWQRRNAKKGSVNYLQLSLSLILFG